MKRLLPLLFLATPAMAQQPPEMVLIPRPVAEQALQWIATPNAANAVMLYAAFSACMRNNPHQGVTTRAGGDDCPTVTDAIAARDKEIADLKKQIADLKLAVVSQTEPGKP